MAIRRNFFMPRLRFLYGWRTLSLYFYLSISRSFSFFLLSLSLCLFPFLCLVLYFSSTMSLFLLFLSLYVFMSFVYLSNSLSDSLSFFRYLFSLSLSFSLLYSLYYPAFVFVIQKARRNKRKIIFTLLVFWIILGRMTTSVHWLMEYRRVLNLLLPLLLCTSVCRNGSWCQLSWKSLSVNCLEHPSDVQIF